MATPVGDSYAVASGGVIAAGRTRYPHAALLNTIAAAPSESWINVNANTIQSVFPSSDYCPPFGGGYSDPATIILAWSGFGWDSKNHRLIIWGGGHANSSANHVFYWDAVDRNWKLAYHAADVIYNATSGYINADGDLHSPISSHTYSNNIYLPKIDRFLTFGGAAHGSGYSFVIRDGDTTLRGLPGGYTLDMANAGKGWVGGVTGSNPQRGTTAGVNIQGANAWYPRDYLSGNPTHVTAGLGHGNGKAAYAEEGGKDVVYVAGSIGGGTSPHLFRIEYSSASDYTTDTVTKVGAAWNNNATDGGADIDTVRNVFAHIGDASYPFYGWDLKHAAPNNNNFRIAPAGLTGSGAAEFLTENLGGMGMLFDRQRGYFVLWSRGGKLWSIQVPDGDPTPTTGWVVTKLADPASPRPALAAELAATNNEDTGVHGKWKYAPDLDCYIGLQGKNAGNIWLFKPTSWIDPRV